MGFHLIQTGAAEMQDVPPPPVDLSRSCPPKYLVKHDIGHVIVPSTHLTFWHRECMRIRPKSCQKNLVNIWGHCVPCSCPSHRECPEIRYTKRLSNVISAHGARALDQHVSTLAGIPRLLEKVVKPSAELRDIQYNEATK